MLSSILAGLLVAWVLALFGFNHVVINGLHELLNIKATNAAYYLIFAVLGLIYGVFSALRD